MLKKTSPEGVVVEISDDPPTAALADFDVDGAELKSDHSKWLDLNIVDPIKRKKGIKGFWQIFLVGRADKSGGNKHNLELSKNRADAVRSYILARTPGLSVVWNETWVGEESPPVRIRNVDLGKVKDISLFATAEVTVAGDLERVESEPSWTTE